MNYAVKAEPTSMDAINILIAVIISYHRVYQTDCQITTHTYKDA